MVIVRGVNKKKLAKKPERKKLIEELDSEFSKFIRRRDGYKCITCGSTYKPQCGHYVSRKYMSTRWDARNCNCQCMACNVFLHGNMDEYAIKLKEKYGEKVLEELNELKHTTVKYTLDELLDLINYYKHQNNGKNI